MQRGGLDQLANLGATIVRLLCGLECACQAFIGRRRRRLVEQTLSRRCANRLGAAVGTVAAAAAHATDAAAAAAAVGFLGTV